MTSSPGPVLPPSHRRARRSWARHVEGVDASLDGGWMFQGEWLERGEAAALVAGDLVLLFDGWDTRQGPRIEAALLRCAPDGLETVATSSHRGWALELARAAAPMVPASGVTRRALEEEIDRARRHLAALEARLESCLDDA